MPITKIDISYQSEGERITITTEDCESGKTYLYSDQIAVLRQDVPWHYYWSDEKKGRETERILDF